ncbi:unnamed protein product, partial [marine sediment metagenome]
WSKKTILNNFDNITTFIGPNEAGKSNILLAIQWALTKEPLSKEHLPVKLQGKNIPDFIVCSAYFSI